MKTTMNISLPAPMRNWVQGQIESGQYASASDYIRDLIRRDRERKNKQAALVRALIEGEESGVSDRSLDEIFADAKARAEAETSDG